jgi:hypothetical protein
MMALLLACQSPDVPVVATEPTMAASVRSAKVGADQPIELTVAGDAPPGWTIELGAPSSEGLAVAASDPVQDGSHVSQQFTLTGPTGSYVIELAPGRANGPEGTTMDLPMAPLFVDIGVEGPSGGPMADLLPTPPEREIPWIWIAAGAGAVALLGAGLYALRRSRPSLPPPPPYPAHVVARRAWDDARRAGLDDHALALRLSAVLRAYFDQAIGYPASARTTREILAHLEQAGTLDAAHRGRARHILDATDRLKFAREGGGAGFFEALDDDFGAVLDATRPRAEEVPHD